MHRASSEISSGVARRARTIWNAITLLGTSAVAAIGVIIPAHAQTPPDPPGTSYGMGLLPASSDQIAHFPKAPELKAAGIPRKIDLSGFFPAIMKQGLQGSCVAWSSGYALRGYYVPQNVPSPAYIYNHSTGDYGPGACGNLGMQVDRALDILKGGVVSLAEMPYDATSCSPPPDVAMQTKATKFRIRAWHFIHPSSIDQIKAYIADSQPIVFATKLAKSFLEYRGGGVYSRNPREPLLPDGSHAMVLVGYDDDREAFRLQNSWGSGWGDNGRGWLSYETFYHRPNGGDAIEAYIIYAARAFASE